jgi:hypothetical protein
MSVPLATSRFSVIFARISPSLCPDALDSYAGGSGAGARRYLHHMAEVM